MEAANYLLHAWTKDPLVLKEDAEGKVLKTVCQGRWKALKIGATAAANVFSCIQQALGLGVGIAAGASLGCVATVTKEITTFVKQGRLADADERKETLVEYAQKGAIAGVMAGTIASGIVFGPLSVISYGLSWAVGSKGAFARSNFLASRAVSKLQKAGSNKDVLLNTKPPVAPYPEINFENEISYADYPMVSLPGERANLTRRQGQRPGGWVEVMQEPIMRGTLQAEEWPFLAVRLQKVAEAPRQVVPSPCRDNAEASWTVEINNSTIQQINEFYVRNDDSALIFFVKDGDTWRQELCNATLPLFTDFYKVWGPNSDKPSGTNPRELERLKELLNGETLRDSLGFEWKLWENPSHVGRHTKRALA